MLKRLRERLGVKSKSQVQPGKNLAVLWQGANKAPVMGGGPEPAQPQYKSQAAKH